MMSYPESTRNIPLTTNNPVEAFTSHEKINYGSERNLPLIRKDANNKIYQNIFYKKNGVKNLIINNISGCSNSKLNNNESKRDNSVIKIKDFEQNYNDMDSSIQNNILNQYREKRATNLNLKKYPDYLANDLKKKKSNQNSVNDLYENDNNYIKGTVSRRTQLRNIGTLSLNPTTNKY